MVRYDDDERIQFLEEGLDSEAFIAGGAKAKYFNRREASLGNDKFEVLVELTGLEAGNKRPGLDIVMVLDISGSMGYEGRLEHMKTASKFVIKKLSPIDRLSIVTFCSTAEKLCPLRLMTQDAQSEMEDLITKLQDKSTTNIKSGLEEAVKVLNGRMYTKGRQAAIFLMSDGNPDNASVDGTQVHTNDVPVHTFGLGEDYHPKVLHDIAKKSKGGTFSTAGVGSKKISNLSIAFSQCLAGLLSVAVKDLTLIITQKKSNIKNVSIGNYPQSRDDSNGSVTISFGDLYSKEKRNILIDLVLHEVDQPKGTDILEFEYYYKSTNDQVCDTPPVVISVSRTKTPTEKEDIQVLMEKARQYTAERMVKARESADKKDFEKATEELNDANQKLGRSDIDPSQDMIKSLEAEVTTFLKFMETPDIYDKLGRPFALASELSHALQRFAARGDVNELRMFATKSMDQYLTQVQEYENDPEKPVPRSDIEAEQRLKEEFKNMNPAAKLAGALVIPVANAIQTLKLIEEIINASL